MKRLRQAFSKVSKKAVAAGSAILTGASAQASTITDAVDTAMTTAETDLGLIFVAVIGVVIALVVFRFIRRAIGG